MALPPVPHRSWGGTSRVRDFEKNLDASAPQPSQAAASPTLWPLRGSAAKLQASWSNRMADRMSAERRSFVMSRIRGKNTLPELTLFAALSRRGLRFARHAKGIPGHPDITFRRERIAVFVDGDFLHGWRYPAWKRTLAPFWRAKIEANRRRDRRTFSRLRREGWRVVRVWEHQVLSSASTLAERIEHMVEQSRSNRNPLEDEGCSIN